MNHVNRPRGHFGYNWVTWAKYFSFAFDDWLRIVSHLVLKSKWGHLLFLFCCLPFLLMFGLIASNVVFIFRPSKKRKIIQVSFISKGFLCHFSPWFSFCVNLKHYSVFRLSILRPKERVRFCVVHEKKTLGACKIVTCWFTLVYKSRGRTVAVVHCTHGDVIAKRPDSHW